MKLPIWLVTGDLPPRYSGAGRNDLLLAPALGAEGLSVLLVSHRNAGEPRHDTLNGVPVLRLPDPRGRTGRWLYPLALVAALARAGPRPAVLRFRGFGLRRTLVAALCRRLFPDVRLIVQPACQGVDDAVALAGQRFGAYRLRGLLAADGIFAMNRPLEESTLAAGYSPERLHRVRNPVDTGRFRPADAARRRALRGRLGLADQAVVVITSGRISRRKGQALVTEAVAGLVPEHDLVLVHLGPTADDAARMGLPAARVAAARAEEERIRVAAAHSGLVVKLAGLVPDVAPWLAAADLSIHAATEEGESNALNEAMASGLPCVVAASEVYREQLPEGHGLGFTPSDPGSLSSALRRLLETPSRRFDVGRLLRAHVESTRSVEAVARDYGAALRAVAEHR